MLQYLKNSFLIHKKHSVPVTKSNQLLLFGEVIAGYYENHINASGQKSCFVILKLAVNLFLIVFKGLICYYNPTGRNE
jgi:hypothetical protein